MNWWVINTNLQYKHSAFSSSTIEVTLAVLLLVELHTVAAAVYLRHCCSNCHRRHCNHLFIFILFFLDFFVLASPSFFFCHICWSKKKKTTSLPMRILSKVFNWAVAIMMSWHIHEKLSLLPKGEPVVEFEFEILTW